jgi:hypothetical protein
MSARVCAFVAMMAGMALGPARAQSSAQQAAIDAAIPVQAGANIDHDSVTVGDVVTLTLRVRAPLGAAINFPTGLDSVGPVQSLEPPLVRNGADSSSAADRLAVYRVAPWDVGALQLRLGDVLVQTDDGERRITPPLPTLFVRTVLPADTTLRVPKPARELLTPLVPTAWWLWALGALAVLLVGLGIWWWSRRRNQSDVPTGDPYADAENAFGRIERLGLVQAGEPGRHAALMTDVLRRYVASRVTGASLALTSQELLAAVRGSATVPYARLDALLAIVDPVKFARAPISAADARAVGEEAHAIVRTEHDQALARAAAAAEAVTRGKAAA